MAAEFFRKAVDFKACSLEFFVPILEAVTMRINLVSAIAQPLDGARDRHFTFQSMG